MLVKVIKVPDGEAPEHIRRQWVGCVFEAKFGVYDGFGIATGRYEKAEEVDLEERNRRRGIEVPEDLIAPDTKRISDMEIGEVGYIAPAMVLVNDDNRCYVHGSQEVFDRNDIVMTVKVERTTEGFVITVPPNALLRRRSTKLDSNHTPVCRIIRSD